MKRKARFLFKKGLSEYIDRAKLLVGEPAYCEDTEELYIGGASGPVKVAKNYLINNVVDVNGEFTLTPNDLNTYSKEEIDEKVANGGSGGCDPTAPKIFTLEALPTETEVIALGIKENDLIAIPFTETGGV